MNERAFVCVLFCEVRKCNENHMHARVRNYFNKQ